MTENRRIEAPPETEVPGETSRTSSHRSLGEQLQEARQASGMELSEIARLTHVRRDYLVALEHGHYTDLPEPVYTRNFVRLFAQTIGLPATEALAAYDRERDGPVASQPVAATRGRPATRAAGVTGAAATGAAAAASREPRRAPPSSNGPALGGLIPTLLLVFVVVGLAVWGFNSTLFRPGTPQNIDTPAQTIPLTPVEQELPTALPEAAETVRLSITSEPAGARVYVDEFPLDGVTPISNAPVTGRDSRMVRLELDGFEPSEASVDLSFDRNLSFVLVPAGTPEEAEADADAAAAGETLPGQPVAAAGGAGQISLTVSDLSWLEVYQGTQRSGTPLVYTTATPGQAYRFNLPVFIHVGNAAGVQAVVDGEDIGSLGSAGQVLGRAFTQ